VRASSDRETWIRLPIFAAAAVFRITIFCDTAREFFSTSADRARVNHRLGFDIRVRNQVSKRKKTRLSRGMAGPSQLEQHGGNKPAA
jgi:hypothetical protein